MGRSRDRQRRLNAARRPVPAAGTIRCFIALQPDDAARAQLDELACAEHQRYPHARRMRRDNLHLTLAFIGALPIEAAHEVALRLTSLPVDPFDWILDEVGAFGGARVLWAGGADEQLETLAASSRALLDALAVHYDRKPFVAHVTLLRNLPRAAADTATHRIEPAIAWRVGAPVLLRSSSDELGIHYIPVRAGNG